MSIPPHVRTQPAEALRAVSNCRGTLVLDFDYNLYLGNSTEDYLGRLRPAWLAYALICTITFLVRTFGPFWGIAIPVWRDFLWAQATWLLFPWGRTCWKETARLLMEEKANKDMVSAAQNSQARRIIIVSFGYLHILRALAEALPFEVEILCSRAGWRATNLRIETKREAVRRILSEEEIRSAVFVTDSQDDQDLLELFENAHCVAWTKTAPFPFANVYVPFRYTAEGKYAVPDILWNQHFTEDLIVLLLAYPGSLREFLAIPLLFVSFFCVYEMGYFENNTLAASREENPTVAPGHASFSSYGIHRRGTVWSAATGLLGCLLCEGHPWWVNMALWGASLCFVRAAFHLFNRLNPSNRIYIFPFLQIFKMFSYTLIIKVSPAGGLLLAAQVMRQTTNYMIYRYGGNTRTFRRQAHRLLVYVMGAFVLILAGYHTVLMNDWRLYAGLTWCAYRTLRETYGHGLHPARLLVARLGVRS